MKFEKWLAEFADENEAQKYFDYYVQVIKNAGKSDELFVSLEREYGKYIINLYRK